MIFPKFPRWFKGLRRAYQKKEKKVDDNFEIVISAFLILSNYHQISVIDLKGLSLSKQTSILRYFESAKAS